MRYSKHTSLAIALVLFALLGGCSQTRVNAPPVPSTAQSPDVIESIAFDGNRTVGSAVLARKIASRPGGPFDATILQRDRMALLKTKGFRDVRLEIQNNRTTHAKIVIFHIVEAGDISR
jgi:outer membrane protein assembly factor BamA